MLAQTVDSFSSITPVKKVDSSALSATKVYLYTTIKNEGDEPQFFHLKYDTWASLGLTIFTFSLGYWFHL